MPTQSKKYIILSAGILFIALAYFGGLGVPAKDRARSRENDLVTTGISEELSKALVAQSVTASQVDVSRFDPLLSAASQEGGVMGTVFKRTGSDVPPNISAHAYIVSDFKQSAAYAAKNTSARWPLASLTKLVTGAVASKWEGLSAEMPYVETAGQVAGDVAFKDSSQTTLRYTGKDLVRMMLVASNNDAAEALAHAFGREQFIAKMNELANSIGLHETHFDDPSGLSAGNQSTLDELSSFVRHLYGGYRELFRETTQKSIAVTERSTMNTQTFPSTNLFAGTSGFLGGKTGYTPEAGGNLISIFSYRNEPVLIIVFGSEDRFHDTERLLDWFKQSYK